MANVRIPTMFPARDRGLSEHSGQGLGQSVLDMATGVDVGGGAGCAGKKCHSLTMPTSFTQSNSQSCATANKHTTGFLCEKSYPALSPHSLLTSVLLYLATFHPWRKHKNNRQPTT